MKIHPQTIYNNGQPEFIVLPIKEYERLLQSIEDSQDILEIRDYFIAKQETFPIEVVSKLAEDKNPIKVYREFRKISQSELANKVNLSKQYISQLENGTRSGTTKVLKQIAKVLDVELDDLIK